MRPLIGILLSMGILLASSPVLPDQSPKSERLRVIIETDAGGDPDDEQSLVRFLLYSNEWDIEGIICNRPQARTGENRNQVRTGLGIVQALLTAYGECYPNLVKHDRRFPSKDYLWQRTLAGYKDSTAAVDRIIAAVDDSDPRPVWYCDWGSDNGSDENNLKRALDRILQERGLEGYTRFKNKLCLSSADAFGDHTRKISPPFPLWIDTFHPELEGKRWYHRFAALTATAGGFDVKQDVLTGHGPLGALYPVNTTHPAKEGDTMTFLYLIPTGMNDPLHPEWGGWAGRYGRNPQEEGRPYYWANQMDTWQGSTNRDNVLKRWAIHLQNDFKARLDWCVTDVAHANHPPIPQVAGALQRTAFSGEKINLNASKSTDPDGHRLTFEWLYYPEPGTYQGSAPTIQNATSAHASLIAPVVTSPQTIHLLLLVTDDGQPALTRYRRVIIAVQPKKR